MTRIKPGTTATVVGTEGRFRLLQFSDPIKYARESRESFASSHAAHSAIDRLADGETFEWQDWHLLEDDQEDPPAGNR